MISRAIFGNKKLFTFGNKPLNLAEIVSKYCFFVRLFLALSRKFDCRMSALTFGDVLGRNVVIPVFLMNSNPKKPCVPCRPQQKRKFWKVGYKPGLDWQSRTHSIASNMPNCLGKNHANVKAGILTLAKAF